MFLISHRGNIEGPNKEKENNPDYILRALEKNFHVEIDIWVKQNQIFLGHDDPTYKVTLNFIKNNSIWCHAKNFEALLYLRENNCHFFWHQNDKYTITSKGYIWAYPGETISKDAICVLPESFNWKVEPCAGICSDYIIDYK